MTGRHDLHATLPWMRAGTTHLLAEVDTLTDDDLRAPSALPGWTRAHLVGHLARNAEALNRLAAWASTGEESPMYANPQQRADEIEQSATLPATTLRPDLASTAATLDNALTALTAQQWQTQVRSALGRTIPAAEVPWMRIREVWLHAADLDTGATLTDLPQAVLDLLLDDVTATLSAKQDCPSLELAPADRSRRWRLGRDEPGSSITAPAADLVGWLTGRIHDPARPTLPRWL
jgi:maleylpyruvate isomerase